ncbi:MAG: hypothetical protein JNK60_15650, partial [Acidobacteria bacterium]|nr:hypothetical protein [Acidobacteriota bacterium]
MIPIVAALCAAMAAITALHLRSRPRGGAAPYPSFQHLDGLAPRRRPAWPLEDPVRWALRLLSLVVVAVALVLARREIGKPLAILVEPGAAGWSAAKTLAEESPGIAVAMTFADDRPEVVGSPRSLESIERARRTLGSCSARYMGCLVRAAREIDGDALVVSRFVERPETFQGLRSLR